MADETEISCRDRVSAWSGWLVAGAMVVLIGFGLQGHRDVMSERQASHKESLAVIERMNQENSKVHHQQYLANRRALEHTLKALKDLEETLRRRP